MLGDIISGAVAPIYGPGIIDVDLRTVRGQSLRFSHTRYWSMKGNTAPPHVTVLRDALILQASDHCSHQFGVIEAPIVRTF